MSASSPELCPQPPPAPACRRVSQLTGQCWLEKGAFCSPLLSTGHNFRKPLEETNSERHLQVFEMKKASKGIIPDHREWVRIQQSENKTGFSRDGEVSHEVKPFLFLLLGADLWAKEGSSQPKDNPLGSQLSSPLWWGQWGRDPLLAESSAISPILPLCPHLGKYGPWEIWTDGHYSKPIFC